MQELLNKEQDRKLQTLKLQRVIIIGIYWWKYNIHKYVIN